jgi:hypothetical protein
MEIETPTLKTINYRGIARFHIPIYWKEEYEERGGGTFYEDGDDTGTLRLNTITMKAPSEKIVDTDLIRSLLNDLVTKTYGTDVTILRRNVVLARFDLESQERGQPIKIRSWHIMQALPPDHARNLLFTYTVFATRFDEPENQADMELLDREIRNCELASVLGESSSTKEINGP